MIVGKRYIITKSSDDGTFELGDHIMMNDDGSICCIEAQGWICESDVGDALKGAEYVVDVRYYEDKIEKLKDRCYGTETKRT